MSLFPEFRARSWDWWRDIAARLTPSVREFYGVIGRGAGKSFFCAMVACAFAARSYQRAPGERIFVGVFAPDRKQAGVTFKYVLGLLRSVPELAALIVGEQKERIELSNAVTIEVLTASTAAPRGRSYALAIVEEAAFLTSDDSANPDLELLRALRPALARVPGSLLCVVSSPYARRGVTWEAERKHGGKPDGRVVYVRKATLELNPTFDAAAIETALAEDPEAARAEYLAEFRGDIESFVTQEALDAVIVPGRLELPPVAGVAYVAFLDFAGGSGQDSATLGIAHKHEAIAVLDLVREVRPPFSPESVCRDFAATLKLYGVSRATADRYAGDFPAEQMRKHGVAVEPSERVKSDIYRELLPALNSGAIELLDLPRLRAQLAGLERRTARSGKDSIDHSAGAHDDVANSAAGALVAAVAAPAIVPRKATWGRPRPHEGGRVADRRRARVRPEPGSRAVLKSQKEILKSRLQFSEKFSDQLPG